MITHNQAGCEAKVLARVLLNSATVSGVGVFGSFIRGKQECPTIGDLDILILMKSGNKIPDPLLYYPEEEATLGIKMLAELSSPTKLDVFDQAIALIGSWERRVDIAVMPEDPSNEYLEWFYWHSMWGFLRHIAIETRLFDPVTNKFVPNNFVWTAFAASLRHMRDFAFNDGWGNNLKHWEY